MFFDSICIHQPPQWFHCEAEWHWAPPPLPDFDLWFVAAGQGELHLEGRSFELRAGVCFVVRPSAKPLGFHEAHNRLTIFACHFVPQGVLSTFNPETLWPDSMEVRDTAFFVASASRAEKLWRRGDEAGRLQSRLCIENMLRQLADEAQQVPLSPLDQSFEYLAQRIRREPAEKWGLEEMAGALHLSRAQFARRFRAQFGTSPRRFVIEVRLTRARQLLGETDLSVEQISRALGYSNAMFFTRQFRKFSGQTPGHWRRCH